MEDEIIASLISLYGKRQELKQAQETFAAVVDSPSCGKSIFNSMIDAYVNCGKSEEAYSFYKELTDQGHNLGAFGVSVIVNSLTKCGRNAFSYISKVYFIL